MKTLILAASLLFANCLMIVKSSEPVIVPESSRDTITVLRSIDNGYIMNKVIRDQNGKFHVVKTEIREEK